MNRRDVVAGVVGLPFAFSALAQAAQVESPGGQIMGSKVFAWDDMKAVKTATGEVRSVFKAPTATLDELEIHVSTLNPRETSHPPHRHVNEELIILREGQCETLCNGVWMKVGPGSVVFNASNVLHGFRNIGTVPATYHVVNWKPKSS